MKLYVLAIDPGLAHMGWALMRMDGRSLVPEKAGCFVTKKDTRKTLLAREDVVRRGLELSGDLLEIIGGREDSIVAVCSEGVSQVRNASANGKLLMSWGLITFMARYLSVQLFQIAPMDVKMYIAGKKTASKDDVIKAVKRVTVGKPEFDELWATTKSSDHEHIADAIAVGLAAAQRPEIQALMRMREVS